MGTGQVTPAPVGLVPSALTYLWDARDHRIITFGGGCLYVCVRTAAVTNAEILAPRRWADGSIIVTEFSAFVAGTGGMIFEVFIGAGNTERVVLKFFDFFWFEETCDLSEIYI